MKPVVANITPSQSRKKMPKLKTLFHSSPTVYGAIMGWKIYKVSVISVLTGSGCHYINQLSVF